MIRAIWQNDIWRLLQNKELYSFFTVSLFQCQFLYLMTYQPSWVFNDKFSSSGNSNDAI